MNFVLVSLSPTASVPWSEIVEDEQDGEQVRKLSVIKEEPPFTRETLLYFEVAFDHASPTLHCILEGEAELLQQLKTNKPRQFHAYRPFNRKIYARAGRFKWETRKVLQSYLSTLSECLAPEYWNQIQEMDIQAEAYAIVQANKRQMEALRPKKGILKNQAIVQTQNIFHSLAEEE